MKIVVADDSTMSREIISALLSEGWTGAKLLGMRRMGWKPPGLSGIVDSAMEAIITVKIK